jgi:hypothetical protein
MRYSFTQGSATSDSRWLAISIHNSAFAAGKFGGELTNGHLDRPSGRANTKKSADDRQGICLVHQADGAREALSTTHILYFSSTWKGGVSRTSCTPLCAVTPSHLFSRMRNPDCGADITSCPSTPTTCTLISRGWRVSLYFGPLLTQLTPSVHSLLTSFYFFLSTSSCSHQSYCHTS